MSPSQKKTTDWIERNLAPTTWIRGLVLDDDALDRRRIASLIHEAGLRIMLDSAANLEQLARLIDTYSYDVVFIDHRLEDGDGFDAVRLLCNSTLNWQLAPIMVASQASADVAVAALRCGCADYVSKEQLNCQYLVQAMATTLKANTLIRGLTTQPGVLELLRRIDSGDDGPLPIVEGVQSKQSAGALVPLSMKLLNIIDQDYEVRDRLN